MSGDANRDELLMTLFDAAHDLPEEERREYLDRACAGDEELAEEIWERLQWDKKMGGFMREPVVPLSAATDFATGQVLDNRFEIVRLIAEGGMSHVYEAIDSKQDQRIALKCPKPAFQRRLTPELKSALEVNHDNICRFHAIHTATVDGKSIDFLTMEYLDGETLRRRLKRGPMPVAEFALVARQICSGLEAAHRKGVVHGDLKSANIILVETGQKGVRVAITDFGLARRLQASGDAGFEAAGTPHYAAPEIWKGQAPSFASDIYALGAIFHEMLTGRLPSETDAESLYMKLPRRYRMTVAACLLEDPRKRPPDVRAISRKLGEFGLSGNRWLVGAALVSAALIAGAALQNTFASHKDPVRLVVMPTDLTGGMRAIGTGIAHDVSDRLARLMAANRRFTSIPSWEATANGVTRTEAARSTLGATHALEVNLSETEGGILARAHVLELATGRTVSSLNEEYSMAEIGAFPNALTGAITAALHLNSARAKDRVNAAAYGDYARGLGQLRDAPDSAELAIASLENAARQDNSSALPHASLAEAFQLKFNQTELPEWRVRAEDAVHRAELRNPDAIEVHLVSGLLRQTAGLHAEAVAELSRALLLEPGNLDALRRLGGVYTAMNLPDKAVKVYLRAIDIDPDYYHPHMDLGTFYYFRGEYLKAAEQFGEVVRTAPGLAQGHFNRGSALMSLGRLDESERDYREALRLRGTRDDLIGMGALRAYQRRFPESTMYYENARGKGPDSALLLSNLADSYRRTNRSGDAALTYKQALELAEQNLLQNPKNAYSRALVGYLSVRCGDPTRGRNELRQAIQIAPEDMKVRRWEVLSLFALGHTDQVLEALRHVSASLLSELSRQPDLTELQKDPRFISMLANSVH